MHLNKSFIVKDTVMQIEKVLINDRLRRKLSHWCELSSAAAFKQQKSSLSFKVTKTVQKN